MSEANKTLVREAYAAISRGDLKQFLARLADDVTWTFIGTHRFGRTFRGKDDIVDNLCRVLGAHLDGVIELDIVNLIAEGDIIKLDSTGLDISKDPTPIGILPAPANFILTPSSQPGEVDIQIDKVDRAMGYLVQYRKDGETAYQELILTKTHGVLTQLASVTRYFIRVGTLSTGANDLHRYNFTEEKSVVVQ